MNREARLAALAASPEVDVLVVGGGVNGIGTFRDLAHQGVNVLLVEKGDFCSGSSAGSSHMLHGGIRYLENGEFRLVREALTERNLMLRNAPHYARPLRTAIPIFSWFSGFFNAPLKFLRLREKPSERGAVVIRLGLILYDFFARAYRVMPTHRLLRRAEALAAYPRVNPDIVCIAQYYDGFMPYPERICVELVADGEAAGGRALNYAAAVGASGDTVTIRDELTGTTYAVRPKVVVNAAGPWIDFANRALNRQTAFIGGTKGSHLILDHPELCAAANDSEIFFENNDGRIVLILPFVEGRVMIGTTDIRVDDPESAVCTDDEIAYMLDLVARVFPDIRVDRSHIVFTFCGVRPLPRSDKSFTGNVSRDHSIQTVEPDNAIAFPVLSLVGGKWTTWRAFSEVAADAALARLSRARLKSTASMVIGGGDAYPGDEAARAAWCRALAAQTGVDEAQIARWLARYGTYAAEIASHSAAGDDTPLSHVRGGYTRRELEFLAMREYAAHLDDLVLRRTLLAWLGGFDGASLAEVGAVVGGALGWSPAQIEAEIARTARLLREKHGLSIEGVLAS